MRLSRLFLCTTVLLLGLVSLMLGRTMWTDWQGVRRTESGLVAMELAYAAMQVAERASAERGPAIPVLNDPPSDALRERLAQFQQATDAAFDAALTRLRQREEADLLTAVPALRAVISATPSPVWVVRQSEHMLRRTWPVFGATRSATPTSPSPDSATR